jgi:hypothetical protein
MLIDLLLLYFSLATGESVIEGLLAVLVVGLVYAAVRPRRLYSHVRAFMLTVRLMLITLAGLVMGLILQLSFSSLLRVRGENPGPILGDKLVFIAFILAGLALGGASLDLAWRKWLGRRIEKIFEQAIRYDLES